MLIEFNEKEFKIFKKIISEKTISKNDGLYVKKIKLENSFFISSDYFKTNKWFYDFAFGFLINDLYEKNEKMKNQIKSGMFAQKKYLQMFDPANKMEYPEIVNYKSIIAGMFFLSDFLKENKISVDAEIENYLDDPYKLVNLIDKNNLFDIYDNKLSELLYVLSIVLNEPNLTENSYFKENNKIKLNINIDAIFLFNLDYSQFDNFKIFEKTINLFKNKINLEEINLNKKSLLKNLIDRRNSRIIIFMINNGFFNKEKDIELIEENLKCFFHKDELKNAIIERRAKLLTDKMQVINLPEEKEIKNKI